MRLKIPLLDVYKYPHTRGHMIRANGEPLLVGLGWEVPCMCDLHEHGRHERDWSHPTHLFLLWMTFRSEGKII